MRPSIKKNSSKFLNYSTKPVVYEAGYAVKHGLIMKSGEDIHLKFTKSDAKRLGLKSVRISPRNQYSLVEPTIFGLNEALVRAEKGAILRDEFEQELGKYQNANDTSNLAYGNWVYYPRTSNIFHYASEKWHRLSLILTNSALVRDPEMKLNFSEVSSILENTTVAVIGLSVGNNIAMGVVLGLRPRNIIVADPALYKMTNANRVVTLRAQDMVLSEEEKKQTISLYGLRPKWQVFAEQVHSIDPFMNIYCFSEANKKNLKTLIGKFNDKPSADVIIEVCDTTSVKLEVEEEARKQGKIFMRFTDAGSRIMVDIRRFDKNKKLSLSVGVSDKELYKLVEESEQSREKFFKFAEGLVGHFIDTKTEFGRLILGKIPRVSSSIPQFGPTIMVAGGLAGEIVARLRMGYDYPERFVVDLKKLKVQKSTIY